MLGRIVLWRVGLRWYLFAFIVAFIEFTRDFRLEDVWALPTPGRPDNFPRLVQLIASGDGSQGGLSRAARMLWANR